MLKNYKSIGAMCGSSCDGIDFSFIETDGVHKIKTKFNKFYKFDNKFINKLKNMKSLITNINDLNSIKKHRDFINLELEFSNLVSNFCLDFVRNYNINYEIFGIHGFTIFHSVKNKISYQLNNPKIIQNILKKKIVCNFRSNDLQNGGQGAPLASIYHFKILDQNLKYDGILNIGGISNCTYKKEKRYFSTDLGPGNCLIDQWVKIFFNKNYDKNGFLSSQGKVDSILANNFLERFQFLKNSNNSYDTNDFSISEFRGLSKYNGLKTLTFVTAQLILDFCNQNQLRKILICGGGRKNITLMKLLGKVATSIDKINLDGDFIESQAFAFLSVRSFLKKNISFPETTGVKSASTGGECIDY